MAKAKKTGLNAPLRPLRGETPLEPIAARPPTVIWPPIRQARFELRTAVAGSFPLLREREVLDLVIEVLEEAREFTSGRLRLAITVALRILKTLS